MRKELEMCAALGFPALFTRTLAFQRVMRPFRICCLGVLRKSVALATVYVSGIRYFLSEFFFPVHVSNNSRDVCYPALFVRHFYLFIVCDIWLQRCALFILSGEKLWGQ